MDFLANSFNRLTEIVCSALDSVAEIVSDIVHSVADIVSHIVSNIVDSVPGIMSDVISYITPITADLSVSDMAAIITSLAVLLLALVVRNGRTILKKQLVKERLYKISENIGTSLHALETAVDKFRSVVAIQVIVPLEVSEQRYKEVVQRLGSEMSVIHGLKSKLNTDMWMMETFHKRLHVQLSVFTDRLNKQMKELEDAAYEYLARRDPTVHTFPLPKNLEEEAQKYRRIICRELHNRDEFHERFEENIKAIKKCLSSSLK